MLTVLRHDYPVLAVDAKGACRRDDDYLTPGRPPCDWDDRAAKEALVDVLVRDARAVLDVLDGEILAGAARDAAELLAVVAGQDVVEDDDGRFRIARAVARDRVISTADPEARQGHKSRSRRFDAYKGHVSIDPDSEIIDDVTVVTPPTLPTKTQSTTSSASPATRQTTITTTTTRTAGLTVAGTALSRS